MWQGEIFHAAVARYLGHIRNKNHSSLPNSWMNWLEKKVQKEFRFSKNKEYQSNPWQLSKEDGLALFEHEYNLPLNSDCCTQVIQKVKDYMNRFENWANETGLKESIRNAQQVWIEPDIFKDKMVVLEM